MTNRILLVSALAGVLFVLFIGLGIFTANREDCRNFSQAEVTVNGAIVHAAIATTALEQSRGLGGCQRLPKDSGMYFVYDSLHVPTFWMKGMRIPIDIVWIAAGKVVGVQEFVPVPTTALDQELPRYKPPQPVDAVLEVAAGEVKALDIKVGDAIELTQ